jgi:DNA-binding MarR family transcriptional regulator
VLVEDILRNFGYLALGSRLRRIGERVQANTQQIIEQSGVSIQAGQFPMLAAIHRRETMTIGELTEAVGISQPGVTRSVAQLIAQGLVEMRTSDEDQRRKLVSLTAAGRDLIDHAERELWPKIEAAVRDLCDGLSETSLFQRTKHIGKDTP